MLCQQKFTLTNFLILTLCFNVFCQSPIPPFIPQPVPKLIRYVSFDANQGFAFYGFCDSTLKIIISLSAMFPQPFKNGYSEVENSYFIDEFNNEITTEDYYRRQNHGLIYFCDTGYSEEDDAMFMFNFGVKDSFGNIVLTGQYDGIENFNGDYARIYKEENIGLIDKNGKEFLPCLYNRVQDHNIIQSGLEVEEYKMVSPLFKRGVSLKSFTVEIFTNERAYIQFGKKLGFINKKGVIVIPCIYDEAVEFSEGIAGVELNDKYGYIDTSGKEVVPVIFDGIQWYSKNGVVAVLKEKKWGLFDNKGRMILDFKFDYIGNFEDGFASAMLNGKYGIVNKYGETILPFQYDGTSMFTENRAWVLLDGKFGFADTTGKTVIPIEFKFEGDNYYLFNNGLACIRHGGKYGFVDISGNIVIQPKYDDMEGIFQEGLAWVIVNGKYGFIDKYGREIIPPKYDAVSHFYNGIALVEIKDSEQEYSTKRFFIDQRGTEYFGFINKK